MKLILSVTIISWTLFSTAAALQCQQCSNQACSTTTCGTDSACVTLSTLYTTSGASNQNILKACVAASTCPIGSQTFSQSNSNSNKISNATCCNTDNCNSNTLNYPTLQPNNNLQCYACDPANGNCATTTIQCRGLEDRCFRAKVTVGSNTTLSLGCTSVNLCTPASTFGISANVNMTCCGNSLCNAASTTATTSLYLLLGLLVFSSY
ncbi:hypothetical protein Q5P01_015536 [Channa striata]|uniref:UPAR/Ly6 domain-containing protein n=1 Tax=Channa striata TaxID=64152 RepID=A0AA88MF98_CHASR|nr:hypothetical protein Q5P01_015536 [Channa striata]